MTVTSVSERPNIGAAHTGAYVVSVGRHADGRPARLTLGADGRCGGRGEHATVYGDTRSGVTTTLRTILAGVHAAGWDTTVIDPDAESLNDCSRALRDEHDIAQLHLHADAEDRVLRLVVIDGLQALVKRRNFAQNLARLAAVAGRAGTAVVVGTHDISLSGFGGRYFDATLTRAAFTQSLLTLRASQKPMQRAALRALGVDMDRFGTRLSVLAAGAAFLPRISGQPFLIRQP